ncbi:hypothetical protein B0H10DRAFT_1820022, partial [Mycena sp. CBHHK59/15]
KLWRTCGVKGYRVYQQVGEAVMIPAGCAHQVRNLSDCIKVAIDFVSVTTSSAARNSCRSSGASTTEVSLGRLTCCSSAVCCGSLGQPAVARRTDKMEAALASVAATPKVESRLKKSTSNDIQLNSTRLGHIQVTRSRPKSTRADGVADFSNMYSQAPNDREGVNLGRIYLGWYGGKMLVFVKPYQSLI